MKNSFQVICGNIGTVYDGANGRDARRAFAEYVRQSKARCGRASGEQVALIRNGEVEKEYTPERDGAETHWES